jgi:methionyl-tRNA formyltransferase
LVKSRVRNKILAMKTKVLFMGSDPMALPLLDLIFQDPHFQLVGVFTQPDKPHGRGQKLQPGPIKLWAGAHHIPCLQPEKSPGEEEIQWIRDQGVQLGLVFAYGKLLRQNVLDAFPLKIWNFHTSLLPKYRGSCPIEAAILQGEAETGMTLMEMVLAMDAGPVAGMERFAITPEVDAETARTRMASCAVSLWERHKKDLVAGCVQTVQQNETEATYVRKLEKEDGWLDFTLPATDLVRQIRALKVWPGSFFEYDGVRIKVDQSEVVEGSAAPGQILDHPEGHWVIGTADGLLSLLRVQKPGGKVLSIKEFLCGFSINKRVICLGQNRSSILK